jgi:hypothetical protein
MLLSHPLSQAVVAQTLQDIESGSLRRCMAMGFTQDDLQALRAPAHVSILVNAQVQWCEVSVNRTVYHRLVDRGRDFGHGLKPHPLNQAVVAQTLHDFHCGNVRRCLSMGFTETDLAALKDIQVVGTLVHSMFPWCSVRLDREVFQRLLERGQDLGKEAESIDRMLRLGASTEMVSEFHGLTHQEVALRRKILGLPLRKGRWRVLTEAQDATLWQRWSPTIKQRGLDPKNDAQMLALDMELAEAQSLPLSVVWSATRSWIEQGLF